MPANLENSAVATGLEKVSFIPIPKKGNAKECSNSRTIALISHASKVMLKILQPGFNSTWTKNFKLDLEKAEEPQVKLPTPVGSLKKQESSRKASTSALLTTPKPLTVWITTNCGKILRVGNTRPASWEICMQVKKQQLEPDMVQWTGSKLGKEHVKAVYCHPAYLTSMQSTSWEMLGWMKHKLESRLSGEISITSDDTTLMAESEEEQKSLLMKVKEESEKAGLKLNIQKTKTMASSPIMSQQIDGETMETVTDSFLGLQN